MKKLIYLIMPALFGTTVLSAQDAAPSTPISSNSKFRFGLRITPQPTWFVSGDKNNIPNGAILGFGFGLNMEYKLSETAAILSGIGGDFEGGKYRVRLDPGSYEVQYWLDEAGEFVNPKNAHQRTNTGYLLKQRKINTTFVTIPFILKLSTSEYSGLKYFGMFGMELGARIKAVSRDTYHFSHSFPTDSTTLYYDEETTESGINIEEDASLVPLRLALNVGVGSEYRLGGTTSAFVSINFFRSFTNFMAKESEFLVYRADASGLKYVKQNLKLTGLRINLGIMF